jgi:hypothetical protein
LYFGHKNPPKKHKAGKIRYCKECGIRHWVQHLFSSNLNWIIMVVTLPCDHEPRLIHWTHQLKPTPYAWWCRSNSWRGRWK